MKIVRSAATEESTGEVREMSARKAPEKASKEWSQYSVKFFARS